MKYCIYLITLLSLISLIYSECTAPQVDVSAPGAAEACGTAIENCKTYDAESSAATPKCGTCDTGSLLIASKLKCLLGCKTESDTTAGKCKECNTGYLLLSDGLTCLLGCKTEGTGNNKGKCGAYNDGYTLSSGVCTVSLPSDNKNNNNVYFLFLIVLLKISYNLEIKGN